MIKQLVINSFQRTRTITRTAQQLALGALLASQLLSANAQQVELDKIIAIVDDNVVMQSELDQQMMAVVTRLRQSGTQLPPEDILRDQILERLILDRIQLSRAERGEMTVSDEKVNQTIEALKQRMGGNDEEFYQAMAQEGITDMGSLRDKIRRDLTVQEIQQGSVRRRIYIPPQEIDNFLQSSEGKFATAPDYHLRHILILHGEDSETAATKAQDLYEQINNGTDFAQLAVANSAGQNALDGGDLGWRKYAELPELFANQIDDLAKGELTQPFKSGAGYHLLQVVDTRGSEKKLVKQTKARHILLETSEILNDQQAEAQLQDIRQQILDGADFADMAKEHSTDIGSMLSGGDLGWTTPGQMVPKFEETMNATPEGEISEPFKSRFGWHILQVQERREQDMSDEALKNKAYSFLFQRRYQEELQDWLREIRDDTYVEIK